MKTIAIFFFILMTSLLSGQKLDKITLVDGRSYAGMVDENTSNNDVINFKIKSYNKWINLEFDIEEISSLERDVLRKIDFKAKKSNGIILSERSSSRNLNDFDLNAITFQTDFIWTASVNYERILPFSPYAGLVGRLGTGITFESGIDPVITGNISLLTGYSRHFLDGGIGLYAPARFLPTIVYHIGYRFIGYKGLYFSVYGSMNYFFDETNVEDWGQFEKVIGFEIGYRKSF